MTSYSRSIPTMGLSRTVSEIDCDFGRKSQNFPPLVFCALAEGVPLGIGTGARGRKTRMMGLPAPGREIKFHDIFRRVN